MVYIFIFFKALSLFILGGLMFAGVIHTVKCIFKKHDIDLISEFVMSVCLDEITNAQLTPL